MKYYEYNGKGNESGFQQLQCPICGEAAVGMIEGNRKVNISIEENGNIIITDMGDRVNLDGKSIYCPQCIESEMIPHSEVEKYHEKEHCPGCPICARIDKKVFSICRECVLSYSDTAINCNECAYNYSRLQQGIDIGEMKMNFKIEMADIESGHQFEIFANARRKIYKKQETMTGAMAYEQIA